MTSPVNFGPSSMRLRSHGSADNITLDTISQSVQTVNNRRNSTRQPIMAQKLTLPSFSGSDTSDVHMFLYDFDRYCRLAKVEESNMLDALVHTLQGSAKEFHYPEQQHKLFTAASMREALVKRYAKSDYAIRMLKTVLFREIRYNLILLLIN